MLYTSNVTARITSTILRRRPTARTWVAFGGSLLSLLAVLVLIAMVWQATPGQQEGATGAGVPASPGHSGLGTSDQPGGGSGAQADAGGGGGGGGASTPSPGPPDPPGPPHPPDPVGPTVVSFEVVQQPVCPGGTDNFPIVAQPVTLAWEVTGADTGQVSLSIDGPGVYNHYPADGGDTINFPCEGGEGDIQEHTYLLTATGGGVTITEELVVSAPVHEVTPVGDFF